MKRNREKRVLFLRTNPVSPDPRVEKEAGVLADAGYEVDIFCWDRGSDHALTTSRKDIGKHDCRVLRQGIKASFGAGFKNNLKPFLKFQKSLAGFLLKNGSSYRVIHACDFDTALVGYLCARVKRTKIVYDIFDYYADAFSIPERLKKLVVRLDTFIISHADGVILCSEQRKRQIGDAVPKRLAYIHNAPEQTGQPVLPAGIKEDRVRIVYVGILSEGRLLPELLKVVSTHQEYELHIAGFGPYEELAHMYSDCNDNIVYYGKVEYDRAITLEQEADIMLAAYDPAVPNHRYAAPNKFYEALMLGKPLIMCEGTGFADVVKEHEIGAVIEYSQEGLLKGLEEIRQNLADYRSKSAAEQKLFAEMFSWNEMAARLLALYEEIEQA